MVVLFAPFARLKPSLKRRRVFMLGTGYHGTFGVVLLGTYWIPWNLRGTADLPVGDRLRCLCAATKKLKITLYRLFSDDLDRAEARCRT